MIDTHTHIYLPEFDSDRDEAITRAKTSGVSKLLLPNIDEASVEPMLKLVALYNTFCKPMMGLHPCSVKEDYRDVLATLEQHLVSGKAAYCAIGEIGLDYYWDKTYINHQHQALRIQLHWAAEYKLPFSMHTRDAMDDAIGIVAEHFTRGVHGVFHCFGGSVEQAKKIISMNCMLGIGGVVTYKKTALDEVLKYIPLDYIVIETDAPYLTPVPFRGKRNEPAYLIYLVKRLAEIYRLSEEEIIQCTSDNARRMFKLL
jgi:TatD DNase family protein